MLGLLGLLGDTANEYLHYQHFGSGSLGRVHGSARLQKEPNSCLKPAAESKLQEPSATLRSPRPRLAAGGGGSSKPCFQGGLNK